MNVEQSMCAASGPEAQWEQIDWSQCELKRSEEHTSELQSL